MCVCVCLPSGDGVEGACSLYKGPVCSPWWHLTQCLCSSPVSRALCPATRPVNTCTNTHIHTHLQHSTLDNHTCTTPALPVQDYDTRTHTHKSAHARPRHPRKADLSLSWITDIHTAPCSQNNSTSHRVYNRACVSVTFLYDSVWFIRGWNPKQLTCSHGSFGFEFHV